MLSFIGSGAALGILVLSGVILLPVLLPVAYTAEKTISANETTSEGSFNELDKLSMAHIAVSTLPFPFPSLDLLMISVLWNDVCA